MVVLVRSAAAVIATISVMCLTLGLCALPANAQATSERCFEQSCTRDTQCRSYTCDKGSCGCHNTQCQCM